MNKIEIATHIITGLLASQEPEKGWDITALVQVALEIADELLLQGGENE